MPNPMTLSERRAVASLASIMALRMIGLFMVLPVFSLYTHQLSGVTPLLLGLAMGVYGLSQALLQIPFGALSDRIGRKPVILAGLVLFAAGSLMAASAHSITMMIAGRALQGAGAIGSTILAMIADLTREDQRTKSMAITGMTIGFSFSLAMLLGPLLTKWMAVSGLFVTAACFAVVGMIVLFTATPTPRHLRWHSDAEPELKSLAKLFVNPDLAKLNSGIFLLHAIFTASFIAIPISLYRFAGLATDQQWSIYLPTLLSGFFVSLICIGMAERKRQVKTYFLAGILILATAQLLLWQTPQHQQFATLGLALFFAGFSLLEAFLPSLVSRTAPAARKGTAMGIYSCAQFSGIFVGGLLGGWLYGQYSLQGVYLFCLALTFIWFALTVRMRPPRYLTTQMWQLSQQSKTNWDTITAQLQIIPGVVEVTLVAEDNMVYLKLERGAAEHPDFIRLKEQMQSIN